MLTSVRKKKQSNELLISFGVSTLALFLGILVAKIGVNFAAILICAPFLIGYLIYVFKYPRIGLLSVFHYSFIVNGLSRFFSPVIPFGLIVDGLLVITIIACFFL